MIKESVIISTAHEALAPNLDNTLTEGIERIKQIVKPDWYVEGEQAFEERGKTTIPLHSKPLGFTYPANTQEIKMILEVCNE